MLYVEELRRQVDAMVASTGDHRSYCAQQVAKGANFQRFADETQQRRHLSAAHMALTGTNRRTGEPVSEKEQRWAKEEMIAIISSELAQ